MTSVWLDPVILMSAIPVCIEDGLQFDTFINYALVVACIRAYSCTVPAVLPCCALESLFVKIIRLLRKY